MYPPGRIHPHGPGLVLPPPILAESCVPRRPPAHTCLARRRASGAKCKHPCLSYGSRYTREVGVDGLKHLEPSDIEVLSEISLDLKSVGMWLVFTKSSYKTWFNGRDPEKDDTLQALEMKLKSGRKIEAYRVRIW